MYHIQNKVNALGALVNGLGQQLHVLSEHVSKIPMTDKNSVVGPLVKNEDLDEVKRLITKVQMEVIDKYAEIRKDVESLKQDSLRKELNKEIKLLEASLLIRMEQTVNKMMKDRLETFSTEIKQYVDKTVAEENVDKMDIPTNPSDTDDYEINVTLAGEKEELPVVKRERPLRRNKKNET